MRNENRPSYIVVSTFIGLAVLIIAFSTRLAFQPNESATSDGFLISYSWPGASARTIEHEVTSKIEGLLSVIEGIKEISSVSSPGFGQIFLSLKTGSNKDVMRFEISSIIRRVFPKLPDGLSYPELTTNFSTGRITPIVTFALSSSAGLGSLRAFTQTEILPKIAEINDVDRALLIGGPQNVIEIFPKIDRLHSFNLSVQELSQGISNYLRKDHLGKGHLEQPHSKTTEVSLFLDYSSLDTLAFKRLPIAIIAQRVLVLEDLAQIKYSEQVPSSFFRINGRDALKLVVYPKRHVNQIKLAREIHTEVDKGREKLSSDQYILTMDDATVNLSRRIDNIVIYSTVLIILFLACAYFVKRQFDYVVLVFALLLSHLILSLISFIFFKIDIHPYSIFGMSLSVGLIVDGILVSVDTYQRSRSITSFISIWGYYFAPILILLTLLSIDSKGNQFAQVAPTMLICLTVSLFVCMVLTPILINRSSLVRRGKSTQNGKKLFGILSRFYTSNDLILRKYKFAYFGVICLSIGIPFHLFPKKAEGKGMLQNLYNATIGSTLMNNEVKPVLERIFGGTSRAFNVRCVENLPEMQDVTALEINARMAEGSTVRQINETIRSIEEFILKFDGVNMCYAEVAGYKNSTVKVFFKPAHEFTGYPYYLKSRIESKVMELGAADWIVSGVGQGFSNVLYQGSKLNSITLKGYSYDDLYDEAVKLKDRLGANPRIHNIQFTGTETWGVSDQPADEFSLRLNSEKMTAYGVSTADAYMQVVGKNRVEQMGSYTIKGLSSSIFLNTGAYEDLDLWRLNYNPIGVGSSVVKLAYFGFVERSGGGVSINKYNQQYHLVVSYDFDGPSNLAEVVRKGHIDTVKWSIPVGFTANDTGLRSLEEGNYSRDDLVIVFALLVAFCYCVICRNSIRESIGVMSLIPGSFLGIFVTSLLLNQTLDQGVYASFVFLTAVSVSSGLYLQAVRDEIGYNRGCCELTFYRAVCDRVMPIVSSRILLIVLILIPTTASGQNEVALYSFALGTIGGLLSFLVVFVIQIPLLILPHKSKISDI